jgi:mercuric ion transport protein
MGARTWRQGLLAAPGIGVALLPKLACPLCWPLYAGIVSSLGLGFLISTAYLLPMTAAFLTFTLGVLAFRVKQRRGYGPFFLGVAGSAAVLIGKFQLQVNIMMYSGIGILVAASVWNAWPRRVIESCSCQDSQGR